MEVGSADEPETLLATQGEGGAEVADGADSRVQLSAQRAVEFGESGGFPLCDPSNHTKCEEGKGYSRQNRRALTVVGTGVLRGTG